MQRLSEKIYRNDFVTSFPGDESGNPIPRQTPGMLYSKVRPTPVKAPRLIGWSEALAADLGLVRPDTPEDVGILAGNHLAPSMDPYAACYAGHQFGHWAGQLGDGRAITLGELEAGGRIWELQLKGAGITPYSRSADGRAVLRSSVREYLMSEAMYHLRVPTTRALSLVETGEEVLRDMFYDGNPAFEPGAIVMRVAPCFLRFGNFEMPAARKEKENLTKLAEWTIARYFPHIKGADQVLQFFREVMQRTAFLMSEWMRVGFVHGVMNTDNMSILGLTIDYGPYSFVDDYDLNFTPNTTDLPGRRYAFGRQPAIGQWNLGCLAGALAPLLPDTKELVAILEEYPKVYWSAYYDMMAAKLGLDEVREEDIALITDWDKMLAALKPDMTLFYQRLAALPATGESDMAARFHDSFYRALSAEEHRQLTGMLERYLARRQTSTLPPEASAGRMKMNNPSFILRNYLLHQAIERLEKGDESMFLQLQEALKKPYDEGHDPALTGKRPDWAGSKAGCSMLSCSS